ncbi:hypothetical protein Bbelb_211370 [Branchiostoma belcheri]|nr:hypothetical protein Bbelb_211370 [Branchiostoma belcheri]
MAACYTAALHPWKISRNSAELRKEMPKGRECGYPQNSAEGNAEGQREDVLRYAKTRGRDDNPGNPLRRPDKAELLTPTSLRGKHSRFATASAAHGQKNGTQMSRDSTRMTGWLLVHQT